MKCKCFFCQEGKPHPDDRHPNKERISDRLLVAESLDPNHRVQMFACVTCGHETEGEKKVNHLDDCLRLQGWGTCDCGEENWVKNNA